MAATRFDRAESGRSGGVFSGSVRERGAPGGHAAARGARRDALIINADDWGGDRHGTDAIESCFAIGAITSTTAMVYMADSIRAAEIARASGRPVGLHLNFTQPLDGANVPRAVRERQDRLRAHFSELRRRRWVLSPDPRVHRLVADGLRDQLEQFRVLYEGGPTHLDSHHHVHVCPDVFLSPALASIARVRQTLSACPSERRSTVARLTRSIKHGLLAARFTTTRRFWHASELSPGHGAVPIAHAVAATRGGPVEVIAHPSFCAELPVLRSDAWLSAIAHARLGSYAALGRT